jgi:hypothetical protein
MMNENYQMEPEQDKMIARVESVNSLASQVNVLAENLTGTLNQAERIASLYRDCQMVEAQTEQVKAWSQVEIAKTVAKYKSCQEFMYHTFGERDKALTKHFELLDKAIEGNDKDLIISALQGIGGIVTKSPLQDLEEFAKLYKDTSQPLLDF